MSGVDNLMLSFKKESKFLQTTSVFRRLSALSAPSIIEVYVTIIWCIKFLVFAKKWAPSMCSWGKLIIFFRKKGNLISNIWQDVEANPSTFGFQSKSILSDWNKRMAFERERTIGEAVVEIMLLIEMKANICCCYFSENLYLSR